MSFDPSRISEVVNAFWEDYGHALIAGAGVLVVALIVTAVVTVVRSKQRDRLVAGLTALVVLAWTSEGLWEVARYKLGLPLAFSIMTFFVYEAMMISCALQAERHRRRHASPGPAGRYVWVLASITATVVALNAGSLVEALLRFTLPLAAAGLWWVGITAEREDDPDEVKQLREAEQARKEATWAISWRRVLVAVGVMRPGTQKLTDAERERLAGTTSSHAERLLDQLLDVHLLHEPAPGRYMFHGLLRAHAARMASSDEPEPARRAALTRLMDFYRQAASEALDTVYPYECGLRPRVPPASSATPPLSGPVAAIRWLDTELPNLLALVRSAASDGWPEHAWQLPAILHRHLRTRGLYHTAGALHDQALATARRVDDPVGEAHAHYGLGHIKLLLGRNDDAVGHFERALSIAPATGDPSPPGHRPTSRCDRRPPKSARARDRG